MEYKGWMIPTRWKATSRFSRNPCLKIETWGTRTQLRTLAFVLCVITPAAIAHARGEAVPGNNASSARRSLAPALSGDQVVQRMVTANRLRSERLRHYSCKRVYSLVYRGFPSGKEARMEVEVSFDAPATKKFKIVSESGSKLLGDRVLKRLIESEKEAATDPGRTALTPENYDFALDGVESSGGLYVLRVEPRVDNKFLYRGRVWVDGADFAVVKIEAEPAKNPSFWIKKTDIHHRYEKVGEFWLPQQNQTETKTRLGGTAELTIDYSDYEVAAVGGK